MRDPCQWKQCVVAIGTAGDQLECQFEQGIDLTVSSSEQHSSSGLARAADTQTQCCALCIARKDCKYFTLTGGQCYLKSAIVDRMDYQSDHVAGSVVA